MNVTSFFSPLVSLFKRVNPIEAFVPTPIEQTYEQWMTARVHVEMVALEFKEHFCTTMKHLEANQAELLNDLHGTLKARHTLACQLGDTLWHNGFVGSSVSIDVPTLQRYLTLSDVQTLVWDYACRFTEEQVYGVILNRLLMHEDFRGDKARRKKDAKDEHERTTAAATQWAPLSQMWASIGQSTSEGPSPLLLQPQYEESPRARTSGRRSSARTRLSDPFDM